ncbi:hypothetical protein F4776DRAFT_659188 [Hypoxylon sp. NC0597]|nr:hypothetical protein F4776DRAFT_659188 [Hypoxylon sp. NC0597]
MPAPRGGRIMLSIAPRLTDIRGHSKRSRRKDPVSTGSQKEVKRDGLAVSYTQEALSGGGASCASLIDSMRKLAKKRETTVQKRQWVASFAAMRKTEAPQPAALGAC